MTFQIQLIHHPQKGCVKLGANISAITEHIELMGSREGIEEGNNFQESVCRHCSEDSQLLSLWMFA